MLRDRGPQSGAIFPESSANDAGFVSLGVRGIVTSAGCSRSYVIEVDSRTDAGDITANLVILAEVE